MTYLILNRGSHTVTSRAERRPAPDGPRETTPGDAWRAFVQLARQNGANPRASDFLAVGVDAEGREVVLVWPDAHELGDDGSTKPLAD